jgi:hypothetical protein
MWIILAIPLTPITIGLILMCIKGFRDKRNLKLIEAEKDKTKQLIKEETPDVIAHIYSFESGEMLFMQ